MNDKRFYTYAYLREDGTPYYIGKGTGDRAYKKHKRNGQKNFYPKLKNGFIDKDRIIFLKKNLTEEEAFKHEVYMISIFGRKDLDTGILINMTDGGDGTSNPSKEIRKKLKQRMSGSKNLKAKNILIINISGENYIVCGEFVKFCKSKNLPLEGIRKRIQRGSKAPTKCGWYAFDITNKTEKEVEELKSKFIIEYKNRFNLDLNSIDIKISPGSHTSKKSVNIVFNFIKEKIENEYDITHYNNKKYTKITKEELKKYGVCAKTVSRAVKVLKTNDIIDVQKLNKSNFNQSNYYSLLIS